MANSSATDRAVGRLAATVVGLIIGEFAVGESETVAKVILYFWHGMAETPFRDHVLFQTRLVVLFAFTMIGAFYLAWMARRQWAEFEQVVLGVAAAVVVAFFTIIDALLPDTKPDPGHVADTGTYLYYIMWAVALLIVPLFTLPGPTKPFAAFLRVRATFLAVVAAMAVTGFVVGGLLRLLPRVIDRIAPAAVAWIDIGTGVVFARPDHFSDLTSWILSPATLDAIGGGVVAVALAPWWSRWTIQSRAHKLAWVIGFTLFAVVWTGFYGAPIYFNSHKWFHAIVDYQSLRPSFFVAFASYGVVVIGASILAFATGAMGSAFRFVMLPAVLGIGLALLTCMTLAALASRAGASADQQTALALLHGLNGVLLGLVLALLPLIARRIGADAPGISRSPSQGQTPQKLPSSESHAGQSRRP